MGENMSEFSSQEKSGLYKAIYTRRDVRSHFISKPLSDEVLARILNAAHHAPSVGFSQPWNFVLIRDDVTKEKIKKSFEQEKIKSASDVDHQKKEKYLSLKLEGILESDVNICITYDPTKFGPFVIGRSSIPETGIYSVCCAVQNLWLAARAEGIGVGWVSILSIELLKEALSLPEHIIPIAYLCLGHVSEFAEKPDLENAKWLTRLELKDVIYFEKWGQVSNTDWEEMNGLIRNVLDYPFIK
ncbi:MAG TPA: 5,6-dimethylbenzimidazole synthase [Candidatus Nitrosotenuis sp.]|jgi:5,6-dimethylbenzimidazole synthase|nr:5,6-dimethylbenzimidazole synthase [Candidatus Nitrosotenuis sp.]HIH46051.1 5,6-dimethylbenzimidazole synthase [Candidatus Nitrosotenuis sp.]HIH68191.1 5,6-dimethylbenzimidazole synthase [Candidatus Nitrosotenuis sp.]HII04213.1 5,6-dimethylbenzimidazole synthase [Candidatus Nitrosotenuis sp.]